MAVNQHENLGGIKQIRCRFRFFAPDVTRTLTKIKTASKKALLFLSHLCLDAPLVAVIWVLTLRTFPNGNSLSVAAIAGLGFCIWGIYLFDRLFDVRAESIGAEDPSRHRFTSEHTRLVIVLLGCALVGSLACARFVPGSILLGGGILAGFTVLYYLAFRFLQKPFSFLTAIPAKEITIAGSFVAGIFLCLWPVECLIVSAASATALFLLFLGNCLRIAFAESDRDSRSDSSGYYARSTRGGIVTLLALPLIALFLSLAVLFIEAWIGAALVLTSAASLYLNSSRRIPNHLVQALADLALLFPPAIVLGVQTLLSR